MIRSNLFGYDTVVAGLNPESRDLLREIPGSRDARPGMTTDSSQAIPRSRIRSHTETPAISMPITQGSTAP
jgi:hypothetical protein